MNIFNSVKKAEIHVHLEATITPELCKKFEELNSKNESATSDEATKFVADKKNLSMVNAEFYSIYVIGLYCPKIY